MTSNAEIERDEYLRVVSMSAESAKAFFGRDDDPVDLGPPRDAGRYKPGARVWGFSRLMPPAKQTDHLEDHHANHVHH